MKNRIVNNPVTSIIGIIIIIASIASVFTNGTSWTEAGVGIGLGIGLLVSKDNRNTGGTAALLMLLLLLLGGCKTPTPVVNTVEETYKETLKDVQVAVPGATVSTGIDSSALAAILGQLKHGRDTVIYRNSQAVLKFYTDTSGRLQAECEALPQVINTLQKEIERLRKEAATKTVTVLKTPVWAWLVLGAAGIIIFILTAKVLLNKWDLIQ
ncbi:MAG: hypothetical protein F9K23_00710 [Bacteroidetes bacterium]|nr:MAG: hypothetical protein F9K23_00710 [Bacteroidota bacterium]